MRPSFLSTFGMATDQGSKLGLGKNKALICMYSTYQVGMHYIEFKFYRHLGRVFTSTALIPVGMYVYFISYPPILIMSVAVILNWSINYTTQQ
jgi:Mitogen-activated protein kinase kinase 1 interacting.